MAQVDPAAADVNHTRSGRQLSTTVADLVGRLGVDRLRDTPAGAVAFERLYWWYKSTIEARDAVALTRYVRFDSPVIDVGANLGFFTRLFVERTACSVVVAIEPEARNVAALRRGMRRWGDGRVEVVEAAAAERSGTVQLRVDDRNHADHQLTDDGGVEVRSVALDDLVAERGIQGVGLIKIDVQGAEARVLAGAAGVVERDRPVLFVEVDPDHLNAHGSSPDAVLAPIREAGFGLFRLGRRGAVPTTRDEIVRHADQGHYLDVLCLPHPS